MDARDYKILAATAALQIFVAVAKARATTPDAVIEAAKSEAAPLIVNLLGLAALLRFIK